MYIGPGNIINFILAPNLIQSISLPNDSKAEFKCDGKGGGEVRGKTRKIAGQNHKLEVKYLRKVKV